MQYLPKKKENISCKIKILTSCKRDLIKKLQVSTFTKYNNFPELILSLVTANNTFNTLFNTPSLKYSNNPVSKLGQIVYLPDIQVNSIKTLLFIRAKDLLSRKPFSVCIFPLLDTLQS